MAPMAGSKSAAASVVLSNKGVEAMVFFMVDVLG